MRTDKKGFTVVELLIVIALIGVFSALSIGYSLRNKDRWELRNSCREITSLFYRAKQRASSTSNFVQIDFSGNVYTLSDLSGGAWEEVFRDSVPSAITVTKTPNDATGFAIAPTGIIVKPGDRSFYGTQTVRLSSPRGAGEDLMTITIYPYGGIRVDSQFR